MSGLTSEPDNGSIVAWFDTDGDPYAVLTRDDACAEDDPDERWVTASPYDGDDVTVWTWPILLEEMHDLDGPYLVQVVGRG